MHTLCAHPLSTVRRSTMSQNESQILNAFLVSSSGLKDIAGLSTFTSLFPSSKRSHPDIETLYRLLQTQRSAICQTVRKNIELECKLGPCRNIKGQGMGSESKKTEFTEFHNEPWQLETNKALELSEMLKQMEETVEKMQEEMEKLGKGCDDLLQNMKMIVSEMEVGPYEKQSLDHAEETVNGLRELIETCEELLKNCENTYQQAQRTENK
ncbi:uncharacterized protein T551_03172 [Pneumocystis jirovecii RU7]|uniref:Uncharacterized protein n=1 Tax=Pneumocystis jirovecii (strain RU7) TaxID=1408657 RepID=A0A0W4ZFS4_PNEJ7|nr:uncharacterized protein T551_03172 [Pneumocystis jirovecii RU7]KTW27178.1 hypothetical protein T551_03172 [Pneumocystis jirovecii RU7]